MFPIENTVTTQFSICFIAVFAFIRAPTNARTCRAYKNFKTQSDQLTHVPTILLSSLLELVLASSVLAFKLKLALLN